MVNVKHYNLPLLPPDEEIDPPLKLIMDVYHALGELKGRLSAGKRGSN